MFNLTGFHYYNGRSKNTRTTKKLISGAASSTTTIFLNCSTFRVLSLDAAVGDWECRLSSMTDCYCIETIQNIYAALPPDVPSVDSNGDSAAASVGNFILTTIPLFLFFSFTLYSGILAK